MAVWFDSQSSDVLWVSVGVVVLLVLMLAIRGSPKLSPYGQRRFFIFPSGEDYRFSLEQNINRLRIVQNSYIDVQLKKIKS